MSALVIQAERTWTGVGFEPNVQVAIGEDGRIEAVGALGEIATRRLDGVALLPGFINAHSHAFQRGLRGSGESFAAGGGSFWSWREAMYALVASLDAASLRALCVQAFGEMRDAGITAVGEFHYLHHEREGDYSLDLVVLAAAAEVGIRIVLLNAYYAAGGIGKPLEPAQRRFATTSVDDYWTQMDRLGAGLAPATQSLGAVAHSIRAAGLDEIRELHAEAMRRGLPFHMHVEEQRREIEDSVAAYGKAPMAAICEALGGPANLTAVHCTHTARDDMARFLAAGGTVCVCPLTEANLGDGLPDLTLAHAADGRLCLGTDSNARLSPLEEMRWLEYGQRLRREMRGVLPDADGEVAPTLLAAATTGGARALGLPAGRIARGCWADLVAVDLTAPALTGIAPNRLLAAAIFGGGNEIVLGTFVGGRWRPTRGRPE
ncbi:MAG: formimidoylglutamate deiminase, partial [Gemmatimonadales bacterium]